MDQDRSDNDPEKNPDQELEEGASPQWLRQIQNLSWEPELLTSGGSVVTLYFIIDRCWYLEHSLLQEFQIYPVGANLIASAVIMILGILFLTFIMHIVVRIAWIAFVGISFVFPKGIDKEQINKISVVTDSLGFAHPNRVIIVLENLSSALFSIPVGLFGLVMAFAFMFCLPTFIVWYFWGYTAAISFFILFLAYNMVMNYTALKHTAFAKKMAKAISTYTMAFLFENIFHVYYSNERSKWRFGLGYVLLCIILGGYFPLMMDKKEEAYLEGLFIPEKDGSSRISRIENNEYEEYRGENAYVFRASIPSMRTDEAHLELFVPRYAYDERVWESLEAKKDSGETLRYKEIYKVFVDSQEVKGVKWAYRKHDETGQAGLSAMIPIHKKAFGRHELRIDKKSWNFRKDSVVHYKGWETIPFWKETQPQGG